MTIDTRVCSCDDTDVVVGVLRAVSVFPLSSLFKLGISIRENQKICSSSSNLLKSVQIHGAASSILGANSFNIGTSIGERQQIL